MSALQLNPFGLDRGLDAVTYQSGDQPLLPAQGSLPPSDAEGGAELDRLLAMPNFHDLVASALRPTLTDRDLLLPGHFLRALAAAEMLLQGHQLSRATGSADARTLASASVVLKDEMALRELLGSYRSVLHRA